MVSATVFDAEELPRLSIEIKVRRIRLGQTQEDAATALGISDRQLRLLETGDAVPRLRIPELVALADWLAMPLGRVARLAANEAGLLRALPDADVDAE